MAEEIEQKTEEKPEEKKSEQTDKQAAAASSYLSKTRGDWETPEKKESKKPEKKESKKKGGWFQKIPSDIFLSPGGMVILFVVLIVEILGVLIPIPIIGFIIQLPFVIFLYVLLVTVAKVPFKALIIVPIIELFFPFLPTWIIRLLM